MATSVSLPDIGQVITIPDCDMCGRVHAHRYEIERQIGEGGMGIVYLATDHDPPKSYQREHGKRRQVAVKYLYPSFYEDKSVRQRVLNRFMREAGTAYRIDHQNVVRVLNRGFDHEDRPLLVMEYVASARPLSDVIQIAMENLATGERRHPITKKIDGSLFAPSVLFGFLDGILGALEVLHRNGVVHRDLKPENCLVSGNHLKLTDFGIVKILEVDENLKTLARLTEEGSIIGTPAYMAPEQCGAPRIDADTRESWGVGIYTDLWAFGVMVYELVSGQLPFQGNNPAYILGQVLNDAIEPEPLSKHVTDLRPELAEIVAACMKRNPWERPKNVAEVRSLVNRAKAAFAAEAERTTMESDPDDESAISSIRPREPANSSSRQRTRGEEERGTPGWKLLVGAVAVLGFCGSATAYLLSNGTGPLTTAPSTTLAPQGEPNARPVPARTAERATSATTTVPVTVAAPPPVPAVSKRTPESGPAPGTPSERDYAEGVVAFSRRNCLIAERKMRITLVAHPAFPKPYLILAQCFVRRGNVKEAKVNALKYLEFEGAEPLPPELAALVP